MKKHVHPRKFIKEFRDFAFKSNAVDLAVGVIVGASFNSVVQSLVGDIFQPVVKYVYTEIIRRISGLKQFADPESILAAQAKAVNSYLPGFDVAKFISTLVQFIINAFCIFLIVKFINRIRNINCEKAEAQATKSEKLLTEIRDLLKERQEGPEE